MVIISKKNSNVFFGYYDLSPFNPDNPNKVCYHVQDKNDETVQIFVKDLLTNEETLIHKTKAWNYQQGSRLTWLSKTQLIFNDFDYKTQSYVSIVKDINSNLKKTFSKPLQSIHKDSFFVSIDYNRLREIKSEYRYNYEDLKFIKNKVFKIDLNVEMEPEELFGLEDCLNLLEINYPIEKGHINHVLISEDGKKFIFLVRYYYNEERVDNLFLFNFETRRIELLLEKQLISHNCWKNDFEFLFWGEYDSIRGYFIYNIQTKKVNLIFKNKQDGHPSFLEKDCFISDTYPNFAYNQSLYAYSIKSNKKKTISVFKHPAKYSLYERCDLHPSLSKDGKCLQVDFIRKGKRNIGIINL